MSTDRTWASLWAYIALSKHIRPLDHGLSSNNTGDVLTVKPDDTSSCVRWGVRWWGWCLQIHGGRGGKSEGGQALVKSCDD